GRGDGPSAPTLKDDAGFPIYAADLHQNWRFRGGGTVEDIYRRLRTGLDGTPMPSFSDLIEQKFLTDEQLWRLAQYVRSLSPPGAPEVRDVIHAPQIAGTVPVSPDDSVWARVSRYWFPLVGQVIRKARWFAPAVSGVWVQAVYDSKTVALRVSWDDRTQRPDTANEVQLEPGRAIPMAFFAWDGSSGEHGSRMAVSTWYFLALDRPTPPGVFISPVLAMVVTLGLGLVVVRRAQRRGAARAGV